MSVFMLQYKNRTYHQKAATVSLIEIALATQVDQPFGEVQPSTPEDIQGILERQLNGYGFVVRYLPDNLDMGNYFFEVGDVVLAVPKDTRRKMCSLVVLDTTIDAAVMSPIRTTVHRLMFDDIARIVQLHARKPSDSLKASDIKRHFRAKRFFI